MKTNTRRILRAVAVTAAIAVAPVATSAAGTVTEAWSGVHHAVQSTTDDTTWAGGALPSEVQTDELITPYDTTWA